jgi:hypothetical protein
MHSFLSGYFALKTLPPPEVVRQQIQEFKDNPLASIPDIPKLDLPRLKIRGNVYSGGSSSKKDVVVDSDETGARFTNV